MKYIYSQTPTFDAGNATAAHITDHLSRGERVLWLLSGGSGRDVVLQAARQLQTSDLSNLYVTMSDERFGAVGHADENWQLLIDTGLSLPGATLYRPLQGKDRDQTTRDFDHWLHAQIEEADYRIAIFGIGPDGHTSGIKPGSPAVSSPDFAAAFTGDDFERITTTPAALAHIDTAIIQASGDDKKAVLRQLLSETLPIANQPAQLVKSIPDATLYTNIPKEELL
jgi:6-phosphogluconolactonase/glucosamine-6-phosphate isomerase/deaminase